MTMCYSEPVVVNLGVLFWASGCESCCVILSQWFWIIVSYAEPVVMNGGELFWSSGCESWYVVLSYWLWIMVFYAKPSGCEPWCSMLSKVIVNHAVICWAQWLWVMAIYDVPGLWIIVSYAEPVVGNHAVLFWFEWLWIMVCNVEPVVVDYCVLC